MHSASERQHALYGLCQAGNRDVMALLRTEHTAHLAQPNHFTIGPLRLLCLHVDVFLLIKPDLGKV